MTFELHVAAQSGPPRRLVSSPDPKFLAVAGYRRTRMHSAGNLAQLDAHWAGLDHVAEDGTRTALLEFRRVLDSDGKTLGVSVETLPGLFHQPASINPGAWFHVSQSEDGRLMIEGSKG